MRRAEASRVVRAGREEGESEERRREAFRNTSSLCWRPWEVVKSETSEDRSAWEEVQRGWCSAYSMCSWRVGEEGSLGLEGLEKECDMASERAKSGSALSLGL